MKANLKSKLLALPLLACSAYALATAPILLDEAAMDRVTAGSLPTFEQIVNILGALPRNATDLNLRDILPLSAEQWAQINQLSSGAPISFQLLNPGELVAAQQLQSGEQVLIVKQLSPSEAASVSQLRTGDTVTTYTLNPGESLQFQQISHGGTNYLYVHSNGNSTITTFQKTGL